ncbi:tRNA-guanine(15) transglycosylase-like [Ostreococcus tauri]|uniref:tRNA-guanine(15) transglycosylase-like n=1 Tax=Ostreococcus tauri TaxID=70448 RepID=A0A096PAD0_OSTTA|nr:tRNA-guanine(15) transglycosylase-like [Ostreococcus tauri]CEG01267.1 tRNA-guanine(15) transglycosylase-like [Ostreococcus tauri]|eukprot:XP_003075328.2 tRNA-guanine(15) transglycosylase-like [Ostreococcus tauri]
MGFTFALDDASSGSKLRLGRIESDDVEMCTPGALAVTSRGEPANLTSDILKRLDDALRACSSTSAVEKDPRTVFFGYAQCASHAVTDARKDGERKRESDARADGARTRAGSRPAVANYRDPTSFGVDVRERSKDLAIACETSSGRRWMTCEAHALHARRLGAGCRVALADEHAGWSSESKARECAQRTFEILEESVNGALVGEKIFASLTGGEHVGVRERLGERVRAFVDSNLKAREVVAGYALSGFYAGEDPSTRERCVKASLAHVESDVKKVRYLPGATTIEDVVDNIERGVDIFDATWASETAARGRAFCFPIDASDVDTIAIVDAGASSRAMTGNDAYSLNLWAVAHKTDFVPFLPKSSCACPACKDHTRAYVHHLLQSHEMTADVLLEAHNLYRLCAFFAAARNAMRDSRWDEFARFHREYAKKARAPPNDD